MWNFNGYRGILYFFPPMLQSIISQHLNHCVKFADFLLYSLLQLCSCKYGNDKIENESVKKKHTPVFKKNRLY